MGDGRWLRINDVVAVFRDAGYDDSGATIRRMVDRGDFGPEHQAWFRTEGRYRMVSAVAVRALLARRRGHAAGSPTE